MNAVFEKEWKLYRGGTKRPPLAAVPSHAESAYDPDVKPGELRIFADMNRPFVALVLDSRGLSGWRIVPVSPFSAPASDRELWLSGRVYQLWNTTVVSRAFAARSWIADGLSEESCEEVRAAYATADPGRLTAGEGPVARYEREFLVAAGNLVPFAAPVVEQPRFAFVPVAFRLAACFLVCVGAWYLLMTDAGRRLVRSGRESVFPAQVAMDAEPVELVAMADDEEESAAVPEVEIEIGTPGIEIGPVETPKVVAAKGFADVKGPSLPKELSHEGAAAGFVDAQMKPMAVVFLESGERTDRSVRTHDASRVAVSAAAPLAAKPKVRARLAACGTGGDAVLSLTGEAADGVKVTVDFVSDKVEGYRVLRQVSSGRLDVAYQVTPFAGKTLEGALVVSVIWPSAEGDVREAVSVEASDLADLGEFALPGAAPSVTPHADANDVPVSVTF